MEDQLIEDSSFDVRAVIFVQSLAGAAILGSDLRSLELEVVCQFLPVLVLHRVYGYWLEIVVLESNIPLSILSTVSGIKNSNE